MEAKETSEETLTFTASPGHVRVIRYEIRIRAEGSSTVLATTDLGKPTPQADHRITVKLRPLLEALPPGNYTIGVAVIGPEGTDEETISDRAYSS
jgi:hypothetical protein